jgi:signal transduction histidine kinase
MYLPLPVAALAKAFSVCALSGIVLLCPGIAVVAQNGSAAAQNGASPANSTADSLQAVIALGKKDTNEVKALAALAFLHTRTNLPKAKEELHATLDLGTALHRYSAVVNALSQLVTISSNTGQPDSARYYLEKMRQFAEDHPQVAMADYNFTAGLFHRSQGNYKTSLPYMLKALEGYAAVGSKIQTAGQALNIGNNYSDMGEMQHALDYHLRALRIFEDIGNKRGQAFCQQSIGNDFIDLHQYKAAMPWLEKAGQLKAELGDHRGEVTALSSLSQAWLGMNDYDKAIAAAIQGAQKAKEMSLPIEEAKARFNLGTAYYRKKDWAASAQAWRECQSLALKVKDSSLAARAGGELASLDIEAGRKQRQENTLINSLHKALESGDRFAEIDNYKYLSQLYASNNDFEKALFYNEKYHAASDTVLDKDLQLRLRQLEQQYNIEKTQRDIAVKEKEIALLKKDGELRQAELVKERTIKAGSFILAGLLVVIGLLVVNRYRVVQKVRRTVEIEKLRYAIARDLHDDIGSALSSIHINSNMALTHPEDAVVKNQLEKIRQYSGNMMERMGDIVWAINPGNDAVENLLIKMKEFLAEILEPLGIDYRLEGLELLKKGRLDVGRRKEIYLLFKEAVNNAAKYSGCTAVIVALASDTRDWVLSVTDDGRGFDAQAVRRGNGLRNMRERAAALGGDLRIDSAPGKGTTVLLTIPIT